MAVISFAFILLIIGIPSIVYLLIKKAVEAKEQGNITNQWFYIWLIVMITIFLFMLFLSAI
ncbi:MAG: hypothetical protein PHE05_01780 [Bacilli bacterium]|nr:hypothetical protein [Bacilli bacterium]